MTSSRPQLLTCANCNDRFERRSNVGAVPKYCGPTCKAAAQVATKTKRRQTSAPLEARGKRNQEAIERTIQAMIAGGRIENVDDGRVEIARSLAAAVDKYPHNAGLWKQYQDAERELRTIGQHDDSFSDLLAEIRDAAKPEQRHAGGRSGEDR